MGGYQSRSLNGSATLLDLEALDCPVCCDALTNPIFQCNNGHILCSTCCDKLSNKCPSCALPIGQIRCRAMERIIEAVIVPCPNAKLGCTKSFPYGKESTHEKECTFSLCSCPIYHCNYTGSYKDLYSHFDLHRSEAENIHCRLILGVLRDFTFGLARYGRLVMDDYTNGLLFVVQFFIEPHGVYLTMNCIAPPALEVGEFSCQISTAQPYTMTIEFPKIKKTEKLNDQFPKDDFMLVPSYFIRDRQALKLKISVHKLN